MASLAQIAAGLALVSGIPTTATRATSKAAALPASGYLPSVRCRYGTGGTADRDQRRRGQNIALDHDRVEIERKAPGQSAAVATCKDGNTIKA